MKRVLQTNKSKVDDVVRKPDLDIGGWGLLSLNAMTVAREDIALVQEKYGEGQASESEAEPGATVTATLVVG